MLLQGSEIAIFYAIVRPRRRPIGGSIDPGFRRESDGTAVAAMSNSITASFRRDSGRQLFHAGSATPVAN
jgi:hypothetical protein